MGFVKKLLHATHRKCEGIKKSTKEERLAQTTHRLAETQKKAS